VSGILSNAGTTRMARDYINGLSQKYRGNPAYQGYDNSNMNCLT
jgi:hypothetical protein